MAIEFLNGIDLAGDLELKKTDPKIILYDNSGANGTPNGEIVFSELDNTENFKLRYNGLNDRFEYWGLISGTSTLVGYWNRSTGTSLYSVGTISTGSDGNSANWKTAYDHSQATHAPTDAEANVQSDWNATSGDALILNKPTIPTSFNNLNAVDDRDIAPEDLTYADDFRIYFADKGQIEGGSNTSDYQDLLVLNSYTDATGGDANALAFDKNTFRILHYQADQADTNWGTAKQIAYTDQIPTTFAPTDAEANVQADWTETTTTSDAFIQNKPSTFPPSTHNHDDRYYTESESDAKYLLNTTDSLSGNLTVTGNLTVDGSSIGLYHQSVEDKIYFDNYNGSNFLHAVFNKNQRADIIRYQPVDNLEYWNGSSWQDGSSQLANLKNLLDGRQDTSWYLPSTYYKIRFTVTASTSYPLRAHIGLQMSWTGSTFPGCSMQVEEKQTDNSWLEKVDAQFTNANGVTTWGTMFKADSALHTGRGATGQGTRITVDFYGWTPSSSSHVTVPLQNIFIFSNFSGLENTDYSNLLDYDKNLSVAGNINLGSGKTVDGVDISALPTTFAPTDAEANVQADWTATSGDALILNKPTIPTDHGDHDGLYLPIGGGSLTGNVTSNSLITADLLSLTNDATDTTRHRIAVYDSGATSYGMMLWNTNGTSGEWATMIYGPNQSNRRISFGKANADFATNNNHAGVDELAWLDLDNGNYFTDGNIYPGGSTTKYVSTGRIDNWNTAYTHSQAAHAPTDAEANVQADWNATSGDALILNKPTIPTDHGDHDGLYIPVGGGQFSGALDFTPDTGAILKVDNQTIIERTTANGGLTIGHDDSIIIAGGDTSSTMNSNITNSAETVFIGAEGGLKVYAFPDNLSGGWSARKEWIFGNNGVTIFPGDASVGTAKYTLTVNAPSGLTTTIVNSTINVGFTASTTTNIDYYLIFSSVGGGDYGLISVIPPTDFGATMSVIDNSFDATGTQAYRVYAVKNGVYSTALTGSQAFAVTSAEPTNMSVVNLNTAYYVQWDPPSANARFVTAYNVYKHEHATQASLDRDSATLIYSGLNTSYMYQISGANNVNYHQFWVETTIG